MKVFKTYLFIDGLDDGHPFLIDTIWHEDAWWLVSSWLQSNATQEKIPERLVRLSGLHFQEVGSADYRFLLSSPIPKSVLDGAEKDGYVLATYPGLFHTRGPKSVH